MLSVCLQHQEAAQTLVAGNAKGMNGVDVDPSKKSLAGLCRAWA